MRRAAARPHTPALKEYTETMKPNWAGVTPKISMKRGPSGITIMKSKMWVNWMAANVHSRRRSRPVPSDRAAGDTGVPETVSLSVMMFFPWDPY